MDFDVKFGSCPIYYTISKIEGKWKWVILYKLHKSKVIRYNRLWDELKPIAHRPSPIVHLADSLKSWSRMDLFTGSNIMKFHPEWNIH